MRTYAWGLVLGSLLRTVALAFNVDVLLSAFFRTRV